MMHSFLSEVVKLNRKAMRWLWAGMAFVGVLAVSFSLISATGGDVGTEGPRFGESLTKATLSTARGLGLSIGQIGALLGALAISAGASVVGSEYALGTWKNLFIREPRLMRLLFGKITALLGYVAIGTVFSTMTGTVMAFAIGQARDITVSNWISLAGLGATLGSVLNLVLGSVAYATLGIMLAVLFRSPVAAIGAGLAYSLPGETLIGTISDTLQKLLPGKVFSAVSAGGTAAMSYWPAMALAAVYVAIFSTVSIVVFRSRELGA